MKFKFKKIFSVICIISILIVVAVTPMLHTHTCHDTNCLVDDSHACHDTDCVIYLLINKYECLFPLMFSGLVFLNLGNFHFVSFICSCFLSLSPVFSYFGSHRNTCTGNFLSFRCRSCVFLSLCGRNCAQILRRR